MLSAEGAAGAARGIQKAPQGGLAGDAGGAARNRMAELLAVSARRRSAGRVSGHARFCGGATGHGGARGQPAIAAGDGAVIRGAGWAAAGRGHAGAGGGVLFRVTGPLEMRTVCFEVDLPV